MSPFLKAHFALGKPTATLRHLREGFKSKLPFPGPFLIFWGSFHMALTTHLG